MFKKIGNNNLINYGLCPSYHLNAPGLSWDAMLQMKKIELELVPDHDMYTFFEKETKGGISYISNRYSKANNKYLKSYDPKEEAKHIIYLHANYLYDYACLSFFQQVGSNR